MSRSCFSFARVQPISLGVYALWGGSFVSLRANTYVALTGVVFLAIALIFAVTIYAGRAMVHGVERNLATAEMHQVEREIDADLTSIDAVAHDWGSWDDSVRFVAGHDPDFVTANSPADTLKQLNYDAMYLTDLQGHDLIAEYSPKLAHDPRAVAALEAAVAPGGELLSHRGGSKSGTATIIAADGQAVLVASRPIQASSEKGAIYGTVVFARLLDAAALKHIGALAGVSLAAVMPQELDGASDLRRTLSAITAANPVAVVVKRPLMITAYLRVDVLVGQPPLYLRAQIAPVDYELVVQTIAVLVGVLLVGGMIWAIVAFWVVDSTSLSRMTWLRDSMAMIARDGALSGRITVPEGRRDEATTVAAEVNSMLDALGKSHELMRRSEEQHRVLVENMPDAVFTVGLDGAFAFANPQSELLTGISRDELVGVHYGAVLSAESVRVVADRIQDLSAVGGRPLAVSFVSKSGDAYPVELSISPVDDEHGHPVAMTWIARDVTERREFEDKLVHLASHDHLTGLFNRRRFEEEVSLRLADTKRRGDGGAVVWLDLDNFKTVNDSFGHRVGDEVLKHVAAVLRGRSREEDVLARLGGDEFAMLLPGVGEHEAVKAAERVLGELALIPVQAETHPLRVGASAGVALYPAHATTVDELLLRADAAMYTAKEEGRGRVCRYSPDGAWPQRIVIRREWAERVEEALASDSLVPYAQPVLDLHSGEVTAYELLVRMIGTDGLIVPPGEFLPIAEGLGLITEIDRLMVRHAVALASAEPVRASGVRLFVNLSAKTIASPSLPAFIHDQFKHSGVDPTSLGFELTETALVANLARANELIGQFRDLGCSFALDDFGTGFSSITYLRHMPVDILKIDGGLIREVLTSEQDRQLTHAIIDLARGLGIDVTAEYVENEETLALLKTAGVDYAQGYFIGKPLPAAEVLLGVANHREVGSRE